MISIPRVEWHPDIWYHENILDNSTFNALLSYAKSFVEGRVLSANIEKRVIKYDGDNYRLAGWSGERSYKKLWNLSDNLEYWYQTNDTIGAWSDNFLNKTGMHPALRRLIKKVGDLAPFNDGQKWIPYRCIFNQLKAGVALDPHTDANIFEYDVDKFCCYSSTMYLQMCSEGGEFWDELGLLFKPSENCVLINKSNSIIHGVTAGNTDRLGFTVRWIPASNLLLPGDPLKLVYKPPELV